MFWNRYFFPSAAILIIVAALHWAGSLKDFYNEIWWYDIVMHFLGGLWVCLFSLWILHTQYASGLVRFISIRNLLLITLSVGVLWETYELVFRFDEFGRVGYFTDMPMDLFMNVTGAFVGLKFFKK